jgi:hypothetical protein
MLRIVAALAVVVVLAGCGATDWNSAQVGASAKPGSKQSTKAAAAKPSPAAVAETAAERPYITALVASAAAAGAGASGLHPADFRCIAAAIVHGYGAKTFADNGETPAKLSRADSTLDALPDPSDDQIQAIGAALQRCNVGGELAKEFATGLHVTDPAVVRCFGSAFDTDPTLRRLIVMDWMARKIDLLAAHVLVGLIASCIDLPSYVLDAQNVQVDPTTRACLVDALKGSEAQLKDGLALHIAGVDPDTATQDFEVIAVAINQCRPSAHTGFTVPSG